jgi:hypothetical protein
MFKTRFEKIFTKFGKILTRIETKMQLSMKKVINESLNNKDIYAMFFECKDKFGDMHIRFYAIDNKKNVFLRKNITEEITKGPLFPEELQEAEDDLEFEIEILQEELEHDDLSYDGDEENNQERLLNWFILCWDKIKKEYNNIPQIYFSMGNYVETEMGAYTIDLRTEKRLTNNERQKLLKFLKR